LEVANDQGLGKKEAENVDSRVRISPKVDTESVECGELWLKHVEAADQFYRELKKKGVSRRVWGWRPAGTHLVRTTAGGAELPALDGR